MDKLKMFLKLVPVIAQLIPAGGVLGSVEELIVIGTKEVERRMAVHGLSEDEVLADATETWKRTVGKVDELAKLGHDDGS